MYEMLKLITGILPRFRIQLICLSLFARFETCASLSPWPVVEKISTCGGGVEREAGRRGEGEE